MRQVAAEALPGPAPAFTRTICAMVRRACGYRLRIGTTRRPGAEAWPPRHHRPWRASPRVRRNRVMLAAMGLGLLVVGALRLGHPFAGSDLATPAAAGDPQPATVAPPSTGTPGADNSSGTLPTIAVNPIVPATPGPTEVVSKAQGGSGSIALTFDDGYCDQCVAGLVDGVERTGVHVTFCPNGAYGPATWDKYAERIRSLIAKGQVAICNHTWDHKDLTRLSDQQIRTELTTNEQWIEQTFGVTARPFFRPPYGAHNRRTDKVAAELGFNQVLMWSGTLGDSIVHPPDFILNQMQMYAKPGMIVLAHGNHPATAAVFDQLVSIAQRSGLRPVTVPELVRPP